ncbi:MAG: hypothetical protein AAGU76_10455 [Sedimentibacter sp.]|uniref:hypothetical protein n=1 Tax=Sedimentibacter sp. TaxID=1960295 RepID=UPI0031587674
MDNYKLTYALIKSAVENGIRYIDDNPKRGVRNLLDLGEYFAKGRFQKYFFEIAHEILNNENSFYYDIIENLVTSTSHRTIAGYGINIGYHSFTYGANIIREHESQKGYNVPWVVVFDFEEDCKDHLLTDEVDNVVKEGKKIGIYSHIMILKENLSMLDEMMDVIRKNADCAFLILLNPCIITEETAKKLSLFNNLFIFVGFEENMEHDGETAERISFLKKQECLCGGFMYYDEVNAPCIFDGTASIRMVAAGINFAMFIKKEDCSEDTVKEVCEHICSSRTRLSSPLCLIDFYGDIARIDGIISEEPFFLSIDSSGQAASLRLSEKKSDCNVRGDTLENILKNLQCH